MALGCTTACFSIALCRCQRLKMVKSNASKTLGLTQELICSNRSMSEATMGAYLSALLVFSQSARPVSWFETTVESSVFIPCTLRCRLQEHPGATGWHTSSLEGAEVTLHTFANMTMTLWESQCQFWQTNELTNDPLYINFYNSGKAL